MSFHNLHELLHAQFPSLGLTMGGRPSRRPKDEQRFRDDLERLAKRLRSRNRLVIAIVVVWCLSLLAVAILSGDALKSILAVGAAGAGTPWSVSVMRATFRELFAIELLLCAAANPHADLGELARLNARVLGDGGVEALEPARSETPA